MGNMETPDSDTEIKKICDEIVSTVNFHCEKALWTQDKPKPTETKEIKHGVGSELSRFEYYNKTIKYPYHAERMFLHDPNVLLRIIQQKTEDALMVMFYHRTVQKVSYSLCRLIPNSRAWATGSRTNGLSNMYSDLDVFLDTGGTYFGLHNQDAISQANLVLKVKELLLKNSHTWKQVIAIPYARTPIIKAYHKWAYMHCDISFRNGLAYENTQWIIYMLRVLPAARPMIIILKEWLANTRLVKHLSNYSFSLMVLFFCQVNNYLPSLSRLRSHFKGLPKLIAGWECQYSKSRNAPGRLVKPESLLLLLHDFFIYYSEFNYETQVICPLMGSIIMKEQFDNNGEKLPREMLSYINMVKMASADNKEVSRVSQYVPVHLNEDVFRNETPLCVQDPFDLSHNVTKAVKSETLNQLTAYCKIEADKCKVLLSTNPKGWEANIYSETCSNPSTCSYMMK